MLSIFHIPVGHHYDGLMTWWLSESHSLSQIKKEKSSGLPIISKSEGEPSWDHRHQMLSWLLAYVATFLASSFLPDCFPQTFTVLCIWQKLTAYWENWVCHNAKFLTERRFWKAVSCSIFLYCPAPYGSAFNHTNAGGSTAWSVLEMGGDTRPRIRLHCPCLGNDCDLQVGLFIQLDFVFIE